MILTFKSHYNMYVVGIRGDKKDRGKIGETKIHNVTLIRWYWDIPNSAKPFFS
jgi:hypothetical protein